MKLGILFSGGKDSSYAMYKASRNNEIVCLISIFSDNTDSYMFHTPNIKLVELQARVMGLDLIKKFTKGEKEKELKDLKDAIKEAKEKYKIEGIVTGAVESEYQSKRIGKICDELSIKCLNPLWKKDQLKLLNEMIENNFKIIITKVAASGLSEEFLGKEIDKDMINKLEDIRKKEGINVIFEGGEAESFVLDCCMFKKKLVIKKAEKIMENEYCGVYNIIEIKEVEK